MVIYYNTDSGHVYDLHEGFTARREPLNPSEGTLVLPDDRNVFTYFSDKDLPLYVENGRLMRNGLSVFGFNQVKSYYEGLLSELFEAKLNMFGMVQLWKIQILRQKFDNGNTITYPQVFYNITTGASISVANGAGLAAAETYLLDTALAHFNDRLAKYGAIKQALEAAQTIQDLTSVDFRG
jgi:hypothetical protein